MPKVHNKYHNTAPPDAVYIGRGSKWGNPFTHLNSKVEGTVRVATREEAIKCFEEAVRNLTPELKAMVIAELKGKDLVCFCAPKACHGDVLLRLVNGELDGKKFEPVRFRFAG